VSTIPIIWACKLERRRKPPASDLSCDCSRWSPTSKTLTQVVPPNDGINPQVAPAQRPVRDCCATPRWPPRLDRPQRAAHRDRFSETAPPTPGVSRAAIEWFTHTSSRPQLLTNRGPPGWAMRNYPTSVGGSEFSNGLAQRLRGGSGDSGGPSTTPDSREFVGSPGRPSQESAETNRESRARGLSPASTRFFMGLFANRPTHPRLPPNLVPST